MAKFPNPFFRKYTYPNTNSLRISSLNKLLPHKNHILFNYDDEDKATYENYFSIKEKSPLKKSPLEGFLLT